MDWKVLLLPLSMVAVVAGIMFYLSKRMKELEAQVQSARRTNVRHLTETDIRMIVDSLIREGQIVNHQQMREVINDLQAKFGPPRFMPGHPLPPPMQGPPQMGPPQMQHQGPPQMGPPQMQQQGPPQMGPPQMQQQGPPQMQYQGPPAGFTGAMPIVGPQQFPRAMMGPQVFYGNMPPPNMPPGSARPMYGPPNGHVMQAPANGGPYMQQHPGFQGPNPRMAPPGYYGPPRPMYGPPPQFAPGGPPMQYQQGQPAGLMYQSQRPPPQQGPVAADPQAPAKPQVESQPLVTTQEGAQPTADKSIPEHQFYPTDAQKDK